MTTKLIYIGRGDAFYHVPARDLTEEDFKEREEVWKELGITEAVLIESGLYEKQKEITLSIEFEHDPIATTETKPVAGVTNPYRRKTKKDGE